MSVAQSRLAALALFGACAAGCGGSDKPVESPAGEPASEGAASEAAEAAGDGDSETEAAETAPRKASCDDGTCSPCGEALCPSGWYCDERAPGGSACGWLPECAQKPTCACIKRAFSACSCEDSGGIAHLTCE